MENTQITEGRVYEIDYPFCKVVYEHFEDDGPHVFESWRPGIETHGYKPNGNAEYDFDSIGKMVVEVVSIHKPGRYPARAFYVRTWISPDGDSFGNKSLKVTTVGNLKNILKGYRFRE